MDDFIYICDDAYQQHQFIAMEGKIMRGLGFDINIPIPYRFLRRYAKVGKIVQMSVKLSFSKHHGSQSLTGSNLLGIVQSAHLLLLANHILAE